VQTGSNAVEGYKASKGGDGLRIREDLSEIIARWHEAPTPAEKDLLKWLGVFFRRASSVESALVKTADAEAAVS